MTFFNAAEPIVRRKQTDLDIQDRVGLWQIHWRWRSYAFSRFYTRIDQVFILWGLIIAVIFAVAQFCAISWQIQAVVGLGLTLAGTLSMTVLVWFWVSVEHLRWVVYGWMGVLGLGIALTDLSIFQNWWPLLPYLCPLWLGLSALGYLMTGLGMRSRTFTLTGLLHLLSILLLPYLVGWQFLITGTVMAISLLFLSEVQWDMRSPIAFARLTPVQQQFNQTQARLRRFGGGLADS